jgi:Fur family zinc uptake transcriptional regulator
MAPHARHLAAGSTDLEAAAEQAIRASGVAWTELRAAVFAALSTAERPVSAYDVSADVTDRLGRRIAANSVYRILDLFVENNLAKRVETRNAYVANTHPTCQHDCLFLVCETCGRIDHIDDDRLAADMRSRAAAHGFVAKRPALELLGTCRACAA